MDPDLTQSHRTPQTVSSAGAGCPGPCTGRGAAGCPRAHASTRSVLRPRGGRREGRREGRRDQDGGPRDAASECVVRPLCLGVKGPWGGTGAGAGGGAGVPWGAPSRAAGGTGGAPPAGIGRRSENGVRALESGHALASSPAHRLPRFGTHVSVNGPTENRSPPYAPLPCAQEGAADQVAQLDVRAQLDTAASNVNEEGTGIRGRDGAFTVCAVFRPMASPWPWRGSCRLCRGPWGGLHAGPWAWAWGCPCPPPLALRRSSPRLLEPPVCRLTSCELEGRNVPVLDPGGGSRGLMDTTGSGVFVLLTSRHGSWRWTRHVLLRP